MRLLPELLQLQYYVAPRAKARNPTTPHNWSSPGQKAADPTGRPVISGPSRATLFSLVGGEDVIDTLPDSWSARRRKPAPRRARIPAPKVDSAGAGKLQPAQLIVALIVMTAVFLAGFIWTRDLARAWLLVGVANVTAAGPWHWARYARPRRSARERMRRRALADRGNRRLAGLQRRLRDCDLSRLDPHDFERLVLACFRALGFTARATPRQADGGIDGQVVRGGAVALIQCKRHARRVGEPVVRDFLGALTKQGVATGYLIAAKGFTQPARQFAAGTPIRLLDADVLRQSVLACPFRDPRSGAVVATLSCDDFS
jgi:hypothetical protein